MPDFPFLLGFAVALVASNAAAETTPKPKHSGKILPTMNSSIARQHQVAFNSAGGYQFSIAPGIALLGTTSGRNDNVPLLRGELALGYRTWGDFSDRFSVQPAIVFNIAPMYLRLQPFDLVEATRKTGVSMGAYVGIMMGSPRVSVVLETGMRLAEDKRTDDFDAFIEARTGIIYRFGAAR